MDCSTPGSPVLHYLPEFAKIHVHWVSNAIQPSYALLPSSPPALTFHSIRDFSKESVLCIRWTKYWNFSFSISPFKEYSRLIFFRTDSIWSPCYPRDSQESSQHHSWKASILWHSAFFMIQLSYLYMTTRKIIALTRWTFVGNLMSLLFNMLLRFVIAFLPRSKCLLISRLAVTIRRDFGGQENKICHCFHFLHIYLLWSYGTRCYGLSLLNVEFQASFFTLLFHLHQEAL